MRILASALLALTCLLTLSAGASGARDDAYWLTFKEVGVDGRHRQALSSHDVVPYYSSLSPNRRQLAYVPYLYDGAQSNELWVADVRSPSHRLLFEAPDWIVALAWAPSGRTIAVALAYTGGPEDGVWLIQADGTRPRQISDVPHSLVWSPDSRSLAFTRWDDRGRPYVGVLSVDTGATREVAEGSDPRWSPNGKLLLFNFGTGIRVVPAEGGRARFLARGSSPSWSPDGRRVAFLRNGNETHSLWVVSSSGGRPRFLASDADNIVWSPGSRWIAFGHYLDYCISTLGIVRADGGRPRELVYNEQRAVMPLAWSPRGRRVIYEVQRCSDQ